MYKCLFALGYYGLMRVGEKSPHVVKAANIHIATNKDKILIVLYTSKTHSEGNRAQKIKITANENEKTGHYRVRHFCPFGLTRNFLAVRGAITDMDEQLFIFNDKSPVTPDHVRKLLKEILCSLGLDYSLYGMHSLRVG